MVTEEVLLLLMKLVREFQKNVQKVTYHTENFKFFELNSEMLNSHPH